MALATIQSAGIDNASAWAVVTCDEGGSLGIQTYKASVLLHDDQGNIKNQKQVQDDLQSALTDVRMAKLASKYTLPTGQINI